MRLLLKGHLLTVGGSPDGPVATFAACDPDGAPYRSGQPIIIPLDSEADARQLGAMLYSDFEISILQAAKIEPRTSAMPPWTTYMLTELCFAFEDAVKIRTLSMSEDLQRAKDQTGHALPHEGGGEYWDDDRAPLPRPRAARGEVDP
jgi:hypothetical protein